MNATTTVLTSDEQREMSQWFDMGELVKTNDAPTIAALAHNQALQQDARRAESERKAREHWDWVVS